VLLTYFTLQCISTVNALLSANDRLHYPPVSTKWLTAFSLCATTHVEIVTDNCSRHTLALVWTVSAFCELIFRSALIVVVLAFNFVHITH